MFGLPTYTFFEDDTVGVVDVIKVGVSTSEIVVIVTGGKSVEKVYLVHKLTIVFHCDRPKCTAEHCSVGRRHRYNCDLRSWLWLLKLYKCVLQHKQ